MEILSAHESFSNCTVATLASDACWSPTTILYQALSQGLKAPLLGLSAWHAAFMSRDCQRGTRRSLSQDSQLGTQHSLSRDSAWHAALTELGLPQRNGPSCKHTAH